MAQLKALEVELEVWPLLRGALEVARFVLVEPQIHLEVEQGRAAELAVRRRRPASRRRARQPAAGGRRGGGTTLPISDLKLGDIRIENGTLTYADRAQRHRASASRRSI